MRSRPLYDVVALLARIGVGIVFIAHGWQKIQVGITSTSQGFDQLGVPAPTAAAIYATFAELLGGLALIAGVGLPVAGTLLFLDMAGAFVFVHAGEGLFLVDQGEARNGFELVLVLGLASLLFAAGAGGRISLDQRLLTRRDPGTRRSAPVEPPAPEPFIDKPLTPEPPEPEPQRMPRGGAQEPPGPVEPAAPQPKKRPRGGSRRPAPEPPAPDAPASPGSAEPAAEPTAEPQSKPRGGRLRRKQPETPPEETAPAPRLASDIIGDVRVAGRRPEDDPGRS